MTVPGCNRQLSVSIWILFANKLDVTCEWSDCSSSNDSGPPASPEWEGLITRHLWRTLRNREQVSSSNQEVNIQLGWTKNKPFAQPQFFFWTCSILVLPCVPLPLDQGVRQAASDGNFNRDLAGGLYSSISSHNFLTLFEEKPWLFPLIRSQQTWFCSQQSYHD